MSCLRSLACHSCRWSHGGRVSRQPLLDQLASYRLQYPEESATIDRFVAFVEAETGCFERSTPSGHITGSAWIVAPDERRVLLTHHRKLDCWLQLGGHADGDSDVSAVAHKEAEEESGLHGYEQVIPGIFDLDIHPIPPRKNEPGHLHYDVRYLLRPTGSTDYTVSEESHDLRWVDVDEVATLTTEASMLRMAAKHRAFFSL